MHRDAITARFREMARLSAQRGLVAKGVDMSATAVNAACA
jgi:hypothetical protein